MKPPTISLASTKGPSLTPDVVTTLPLGLQLAAHVDDVVLELLLPGVELGEHLLHLLGRRRLRDLPGALR